MTELTINFEGYWQCRQATDPDPSDDPRGVSGYTFALGYEHDFDGVIRLQKDEIDKRDFRESERAHNFGVFVTGATVSSENERSKLSNDKIKGAKVRLRGNPKFELRNEIIYHEKEGIIMPICPFDIEVEGEGWYLRRGDPLDLSDPGKQVWQMTDGYARRSPIDFVAVSHEVLEAIEIPPKPSFEIASNNYFQRRKNWLNLRMTETNDPVLREAYKTRIWAIDFFSEDKRMPSRLGLQAIWDFEIRGKSPKVRDKTQVFAGTINKTDYWRTRFWMGGFDGDLLRGYMRGYLAIPFTPK